MDLAKISLIVGMIIMSAYFLNNQTIGILIISFALILISLATIFKLIPQRFYLPFVGFVYGVVTMAISAVQYGQASELLKTDKDMASASALADSTINGIIAIIIIFSAYRLINRKEKKK